MISCAKLKSMSERAEGGWRVDLDHFVDQLSRLHFLPANNLHLICLERTMSELKPLLLGSMFALLVVSAAPAQVTIDVSKITCDQYVLDQVTDF